MSEDFDKYLAIANHDIQMAKDMGELKSYVASLLYDNDKKVDMIHELEEENMEFKTTINSNIQSYNKLSKYSNELEDRIEKAIKYIEDTSYKSYFSMLQADYNMSLDTLINILKGVDKE